ncbi:MAG: YfiR family protein [Cyclobacteriaceae bacterium]|nr:YfiR family protein [Cyclobacteriaceae bacterium]MCH8515306.1 YfiR family protein [Cyclobacteriaceae bacterium]
MKSTKWLPILFIIAFSFQAKIAQAQDYKYHALFMYNFTKYIQWPANYQSGEFVIAVLGNSPIEPDLNRLANNKMVGSQKITVVTYNDVSEIKKCHMIFIPSNQSRSLDNVTAALQNTPTLIITEKPGLAKRGSGINFILKDGKWKLELNRENLASRNLKVSSELLKMTIEV